MRRLVTYSILKNKLFDWEGVKPIPVLDAFKLFHMNVLYTKALLPIETRFLVIVKNVLSANRDFTLLTESELGAIQKSSEKQIEKLGLRMFNPSGCRKTYQLEPFRS